MALTDTDKADLAAAQRNFARMMKGLTPEQQITRAEVIASGMRNADPLTRALAKQVAEANRLNGLVEAAKKEIAQIDAIDVNSYRPREPDFKGKMLARRKDAEEQMMRDVAAIIAISEDKMEGAQRKAVEYFRQLRQRDSRQAKIAQAVARKKVEREHEEIDDIAEKIVYGGIERVKKDRSGGHSF